MWSKIIGHNAQIEQLRKALAGARLPNAYLFYGPRGVGKRKTADTLAAALACNDAPSSEWNPCGLCAACKKAAAESHPDVFIVEPETQQKNPPDDVKNGKRAPSENLKIEQIRELQSKLQFHPLEAKSKIAIVDEADRMTEATANSMLKILEEPPPATHFVLISTKPRTLLPTIRSRCISLGFGPVPDDLIAKKVIEVKGAPGPDAARIAKISGGSPGLALSIEPEFVVSVLGRFAALQKKGSSADVIETAEGWSHEESERAKLVLDILASWYRDIIRFQVTGYEKDLIHPEAAHGSSCITQKRAWDALFQVSEARRAMDTTANKQLMFENLLFTLTSR